MSSRVRAKDTTFARLVAEAASLAPWLLDRTHECSPFVHNLSQPLLSQLALKLPDGRADEFLTVSPFFEMSDASCLP